MVKLLFKTPSKQQPFELQVNLATVRTVEQLKQMVAAETNSTVPNIKLIHKGKILKDDVPLETLKLADGETFHAVIKSPEPNKSTNTQPSQPTQPSTSNPSPPSNNAGTFGGMGGMGGMGMGGMGGMDPQSMAGMMDMITPEMMEQMVNSNPMLKSMAEANPQLKAMISNPQLMKQMLQNINPAQMQAAMGQMQAMGGMGGLGGMGGMGGLGGMGGFGGMGGLGGLGGMGGMGVPGGNQGNVDYKTLYADQLASLQGMGFSNENTNIQVLKATGGNVEAAVERLLNMLG